MAWTIVETPNARYVLLFGKHRHEQEESPLAFDTLILESGEASSRLDLADEVTGVAQYKKLVAQALKANKKIWLCDASPYQLRAGFAEWGVVAGHMSGVSLLFNAIKNKEKLPRRKFIKRISASIGLMMPLPLFILQRELFVQQITPNQITHKKYWNTLTKSMEFVSGKGILGIRNALVAEKSERYIAPELARKLGRKPIIAMAWGGAHYGIKELLENPEKRLRLIRENKLENYLKPGYDKSFRILVEGNKIKKIEEVSQPVKEKPLSMLGKEKIGRREFFRRLNPRRRA